MENWGYLKMIKHVVFLVSLGFLNGCQIKPHLPAHLDDGLKTATAESQGVNGFILAKAAKNVWEPKIDTITPGIQRMKLYSGIDSILVAKNNHLVFETYFNGAAIDKPHMIASLGKSIISAVVGVAVDQGYISNAQQSLYSLMPYYDIKGWNEQKQSINLKHLLTMQTGWRCGYGGEDIIDCSAEMEKHEDPFKWVLDLPLANPPGNVFRYNEASVKFMIASLALATKIDPIKYFTDQFATPMQIKSNIFLSNSLTSREMLKFGLLYLNKGRFNKNQLVSEEWISESTSEHVTFKQHSKSKISGYGYFWWTRQFDVDGKSYNGFYAAGNGGQYIIVVPSLDLVVVFTGRNFNSTHYMQQPFDMLTRYIIPSLLDE
jgi:CubicO group peptidase (beta-lactamase class C family)